MVRGWISGRSLPGSLYKIMGEWRNGESRDNPKVPGAHFIGLYVEASPKRSAFVGHIYVESKPMKVRSAFY